MSLKRVGFFVIYSIVVSQMNFSAAEAASTTRATSAKPVIGETAGTETVSDQTFSDKTKQLISKSLDERNYEAAGNLICSLLSDELARKSIADMLHPGNRTSALYLNKFEEAKRLDIAEKILKHYIRVEATDKSAFSSILLNKTLLADVYAKHGQAELSLRLGEEVCRDYSWKPKAFSANSNVFLPRRPPTLAIARCDSTVSVIFATVDALIASGDLVAARKLYNRLETRIAKELGTKNLAHALYLKRAATISGAAQDTRAQSDALMKAFRIEFWNAPVDIQYRAYLKGEYCNRIRGYGDLASANVIEATPVTEPEEIPYQTLYVHTRRFFGELITTHSQPADAYADSAECALLSRLNGTERSNSEPPFIVMNGTLIDLIDFYAARRRYSEAHSMLLKRLELLRSIEGTILDEQPVVMEQIAEISFLKGDRAEANRWLNRAEESDARDKAAVIMKCAALRLEMGERDRAKKLLLRIANCVRHSDGGPYFSSEFCYLLAHAGLENLLQNSGSSENVSVQELSPDRREGVRRAVAEPYFWKKDGIWIRETRATRLHQRAIDQNLYQIAEAKRLLNDARIELAMLVNHDLSPSLVKERAPEINRKLAENLEQLENLEKERLQLLSQEHDLRASAKDFATARITALQQAEDDRRAEQLKQKAMN